MPSNSGFGAEKIAAKQFNGVLVTELSEQYKDIDLIIKNSDGVGKSFSVKDQKQTSGKYKSIQIETCLTDTDTGHTMKGCFLSNESDYYLWRIDLDGVDSWWSVQSKELKDWFSANKHILRTWTTREQTQNMNKKMGRKYDKASGYTIPLKCVIGVIGKTFKVKE